MVASESHNVRATHHMSCLLIYVQNRVQWFVRYQNSGIVWVVNDMHTKHLQTSYSPLFLLHSVTVTNPVIQNNYGEESIYFRLHFHITGYHWGQSMQELKIGTLVRTVCHSTQHCFWPRYSHSQRSTAGTIKDAHSLTYPYLVVLMQPRIIHSHNSTACKLLDRPTSMNS